MTTVVPTGTDIRVGAGTIRPLRREDRAPLLAILRETEVFTDDEIAIALELIDSVIDRPEQRDYVIRVYEESSRVLGYYCVGPTPATVATYDLYWIAVDSTVHGGGVGTVLNRDAEDLIRERGGSLIMVETSSQPRYEKTRLFYRRRGYEELARIRDYYRPGDDLVIYGKYLT
jgi:ribosomal protein S18 acetylase RimI-like enzyme